ncbi:MAG TPA: adenylate/guanylate cyclase domain-containing protein [bacterium]|nr:adenylate/guanylate cyclase domain-containing protein [bacterium]
MPASPQEKFSAFLKETLLRVFTLLLLSVAAGASVTVFSTDGNLPVPVGILTFLLLGFWWFFLNWRQKSGWILDLQDYLLEKQILPFHYQPLKGLAPWDMKSQQAKLLNHISQSYFSVSGKLLEANQVLEKYVGNQVAEQATKMAAKAELGGELKRVYVLFSDIRGFTKMTETLRPDETVAILNETFTAMEEVIRKNGGDINKYIGDAILAYFRRPYGNEGPEAAKVLRAALEMQEKFEMLNRGFTAGATKPISIGLGIGITAGEAIVGNLGSAARMEFTLIGDTVNLASRFCGLAKHGQVLVNEEMARAAGEKFELIALPPVEVKGKAGFQKPFAVVGERMSLGH